VAGRSVDFHPEAIAEALAAREWYSSRSGVAAAEAFDQELNRAIKLISEAPLRWPEYRFGTRRYLFRRFPYAVVYRIHSADIQVIAVAHARRRPGYWISR
jgi:plasmid stabilization system protein ParE